ncbi:hypothetical protein RYX36_001179 [Vicia faba]
MKISYTSNRLLIFIIFTACLCLFFAIQKKIHDNDSSLSDLKLDKLPNEDEVLKLFQHWKNHHERVYNDLDVMANKFEIFVSNLKYIVETNAKRESTESSLLGLTDFADLSFMEFKETYLTMTPDTVDIVNDYDNDEKKKLQDLSVKEVLDCTPEPNNCSGGSSFDAFNWVIGNKGLALESDYASYKPVKGVCKSKESRNSPISAIHSFQHVAQSDEALLCAIVNQPITLYFYVTKDFQHYHNKIYEGPNCPVDSTDVTHAMLIVGYGSVEEGKDYWIVKNTWGKRWGRTGYALVRRNTKKKYGVCGINAWASFPVKND